MVQRIPIQDQIFKENLFDPKWTEIGTIMPGSNDNKLKLNTPRSYRT